MLEKKTQNKILDFVRAKPRTIQEIAQHIDKNWRTAERYVDTIATETGFISTRTFREGTRGALKIAFWSAIGDNKGSAYQERLLQMIVAANRKEDFSPFDIYQFVPEKSRHAFVEKTEFPRHDEVNYDKLLMEAEHQVLFFSGNLSWLSYGPERMETLEKIAKRRVPIKILTKIDLVSQKNVQAALAINARVGWDAVQIRHCEQPLRAGLIDDKAASIKEVLSPHKIRELTEKTYLFYIIRDTEWVTWMQKVFWHLWEQSIDAQTRLAALQTLKKL